MAKRKKQARKASLPETPPKAYDGPSFDELHDETLDWVNALQSCCVALGQSEACGGCEIGAQATNALRLIAKNLHRIVYELQEAAAGVRHVEN